MEIKTSEEVREELLTAAMGKLKDEAKLVIGSIMGDLYSSYLPHVLGDTEANIGHRVDGVIRNMISGNFKRLSDTSTCVSVSDSYDCTHLIHINSYDGMVGPLCKVMGEKIGRAHV